VSAEDDTRFLPVEAELAPRVEEATTPKQHAPVQQQGASQIVGRIDATHVNLIVNRGFASFRGCYEAGLGRDATLAGRVAVSFVIDREGKVRDVRDAGEALPDASVASCIREAFARLRFQNPEGDTVKVVFPLGLSPAPHAAAPR
jgi:hypothetical protein